MNTNTRRDFVLGLVFFGTIACLLYYTIILTGFSFSEKTYLQAYFPHAAGIKEGDAVLVAGHKSGTVRSVNYNSDEIAEKRISLNLEFDRAPAIHEGYLLRIAEFTMLGGRVVELEPGDVNSPLLAEGISLIGFVAPSPLASIGNLVDENREDFTTILNNLRKVTDDLAEGKGALGALINDGEMKKDLESSIDSLNQILDDVDSGKGIIGSLINNEEQKETFDKLITDLKLTFEDFLAITNSIRKEEGLLGAMLNNADLKDKGIALIDSLAETGSSIEEIVADAREGRSGLLGKLLGDDTLAQEFRDLVAHLKVVTARLENGEGSIGKLLAEDDAYTELMKSLRSLNGQLEDAREAQPVSTFTQMLFGRF
jgi:phospholipid/cholesterol/gamma-HCH transport system substrate-binding protein